MTALSVAILAVGMMLQAEASSSPSEQKASEQLKELSRRIRECPAKTMLDADGSGTMSTVPMNVVWNIEPSRSARSQKMAEIEFVQRSTYIPKILEKCKRSDKACLIRNENTSALNVAMDSVHHREQYRVEFDVGDEGLEIVRYLWKYEAEDNTRWLATEGLSPCPESILMTVVRNTH